MSNYRNVGTNKNLMMRRWEWAQQYKANKHPNAPDIMQLREARELIRKSRETETEDSVVMFPKYEVGKDYAVKDIFTYGENEAGEPQLYQVLQAHTSAEHWTPDAAVSLYKKIEMSEAGYPEWTQPLGASDYYRLGNIVSYNGSLYKSITNFNVWSPDVCGWEKL